MVINPQIDRPANFREMTLADVPDVLAIEEQVYEVPWTEGIFKDCITVGYNCFVYERAGKILAYGLITIAADETHILNLCVAPQAQGQGLGKKMLNKLLHEAEIRQVCSVFLEVRVSNKVAINLYDQQGFNRLGIRKNYYPCLDGREDALVLGKELNLPE